VGADKIEGIFSRALHRHLHPDPRAGSHPRGGPLP
jgi:hypothetical protein